MFYNPHEMWHISDKQAVESKIDLEYKKLQSNLTRTFYYEEFVNERIQKN